MTNRIQETYIISKSEHLHFWFENFEQMKEYGKYWSFYDLYRFGNKPFHGQYDIFHHENFQIVNASYNDGLMYRGYSPKDTLTLALIIDKEHSLTVNRKILHPGEILIVDDSSEYEIAFSHPIRKGVISMKKVFVNTHFPQLYQMTGKVYFDTDNVLKTLISSLGQGNLDENGDIQSDLLTSLSSLSLEKQKEIPKILSKKESLIFDILDFILEYPEKNIAISNLASMFGMSEKTMQEGFKKLFGITPKQFMQRIKLNLAYQDILKNDGNKTISEIAMQYGFKNFGLFSRKFKQIYGILPSESRGE